MKMAIEMIDMRLDSFNATHKCSLHDGFLSDTKAFCLSKTETAVFDNCTREIFSQQENSH